MIFRLLLAALVLASTLPAMESKPCAEPIGTSRIAGREVEAYSGIAIPLRGSVGYTNTGTPVADMTIEVFSRDGKRRIATTKTNDAGEFTFRDLPAGTYYLKATRKDLLGDEAVVTLTPNGKDEMICLIVEAK